MRPFPARLFSTRLTQFYRPVFQHSTALSFSDDPLQADQIIGWTAGGTGPSLHIGFRDNPALKSRLASVLQEGYMTSRYLMALARTHGHGYMHIVDGRSMAAFGRCPDPDDIFATVLVQDGTMVSGSLEPMPTHRLLTVSGLFRLPAEFNAHLFK